MSAGADPVCLEGSLNGEFRGNRGGRRRNRPSSGVSFKMFVKFLM